MYRIKNQTNSPHDIQALDGPFVLQAYAEADANLHDEYAALLKLCNAVSVTKIEQPVKRGRKPKDDAIPAKQDSYPTWSLEHSERADDSGSDGRDSDD